VSFEYGGVGDVNGDGYNDLFVNRHPIYVYPPRPADRNSTDTNWTDTGRRRQADEPSPTLPPAEPRMYPGQYMLFYGSGNGLCETAAGTRTLPNDTQSTAYSLGV